MIDESLTLLSVLDGYAAVYEACEKLLSDQELLFHPFNIAYIKTLNFSMEMYIAMEQWGNAIQVGEKTLPAYRYSISNGSG